MKRDTNELADQLYNELVERNARRAAIREQILSDQQSNAKRDARALRAEAAWFARQAKKG